MNTTAKAASKPWIGLSGITLIKDTAELYDLPVKSGVIVGSVVAYGPASAVGIAPADVITEANSQKVLTVEDLKTCLNGNGLPAR